jgi:hypothetical protein
MSEWRQRWRAKHNLRELLLKRARQAKESSFRDGRPNDGDEGWDHDQNFGH